MRLTDDEFRDKCAIAALSGFCSIAEADYRHGPCNASIIDRVWTIADAMVKERKDRIAISHGKQEE